MTSPNPSAQTHPLLFALCASVYVYVESQGKGPMVYALLAETGFVIWLSEVGNAVFSFPQPGPGDLVYLSARTGDTVALRCPKDAQFVVDRMVYVCPELTLVPPTQQDLCSELFNECKNDVTSQNPVVVSSFMRR